MYFDSDKMVSISDVNRNFSKVAKMVDEKKEVIIMKNNKPKYLIIDFEALESERAELNKIDAIADGILLKHIKAFQELAK